MWWNRNKTRGLLAKSLYEPLDERERVQLDRVLQSNEALQREAEELRAFVDRVPTTRPELGVDLLPRIHARLQERNVRRRHGVVRLASVAVGCLVLVAIGVTMFPGLGDTPTGTETRAGTTLVDKALAKVDELLETRNEADAYALLGILLTTHPEGGHAPEAQLKLANLAFDMGRYPEAFDAYNTLVSRYWTAWEAQPSDTRTTVSERRDLLDECRGDGYRTLYDFDVARNDRTDTFAKLEGVAAVAAADPHSRLADVVVIEMARVASADSQAEAGAETLVAAMQTTLDRTANPVVRAKLNMMMGDAYRHDLNDRENAISSYRRAEENPVYAKLAQEALLTLESR